MRAWLTMSIGGLMFVTSAAAGQSDCASLEWLEGDWVRPTKRGEAVETWKRVSDDTMEGVAVVGSGESRRVTEYLRLERFGAQVFFVAKPGQNPFPTAFLMIECSAGRVVFENPSHDFPQRIIYSRESGNVLQVRIEGLVEGDEQGRDFRFERRP